MRRSQHFDSRQKIVLVLFLTFIGVIGGTMVGIHRDRGGALSLLERAERQSAKTVAFAAERGEIVDRSGEILATNLQLTDVNLDPKNILKYSPLLIPKLAAALEIPSAELRQKLEARAAQKRGSKNLDIKKNLSPTGKIVKNIEALKNKRHEVCDPPQNCRKQWLTGVFLKTHKKRHYPAGEALSSLIGRTDHKGRGQTGVEKAFEQILAAKNGAEKYHRDGEKRASYFVPVAAEKAQDGQNLQLTIDANIQHQAFSALKDSVIFHAAESGAMVVLAADGEILALANYPAADPNKRRQYNPRHYRNYALSDQLEPGSTMKTFSILLALDKNKIAENSVVDVTKKIGNQAPDGKYRTLSVAEILQKSHNLGTLNITRKLSAEEMWQAWQGLGFGQTLGILPDIETAGILHHHSGWKMPEDKDALSYGYGPMTLNLAQLARAYLIFANNGALPDLRLIKNAADHPPTQIFSKDATAKMAQMLDQVVTWQGSGYRARIEGYDIAGKTGTTQIAAGGKYQKNVNRTFFVGFAPVENPNYIIAVVLTKPQKCFSYYNENQIIDCEGSNSAAVAFKNAMENILKTQPLKTADKM